MKKEKIDAIRKQILIEYEDFQIPRNSYILFFSPRSGSNLITTQLQSISFGNPFEAFHHNQKRLNERYGWKIYPSDPVGYFRQAYQALTINDVFGVKITWKQYNTFISILRQIVGIESEELNDFETIEIFFPNVKYLFLKRRNKIKQAISYSKGMQTGIWKATKEEMEVNQEYIVPPQYDQLHIECCLDELLVSDEGFEQLLAAYLEEHHKIWYEDIAKNFTEEMLKIYEYIGVDKNIEKPVPVIKKLANRQSDVWYDEFIEETKWLKNKPLFEALVNGNTRYALIQRAGRVFQDKGERRWFEMPANRFKKLKYYLFRIKKKTEKLFMN